MAASPPAPPAAAAPLPPAPPASALRAAGGEGTRGGLHPQVGGLLRNATGGVASGTCPPRLRDLCSCPVHN